MLTVACVWVRGHVPFGVEYVERLHAMARRAIGRPFRFVCLTDRPGELPAGVEPIVISHPKGLKGWWAKVQLFNPAYFERGRVLYLDLDVLLVGALDDVIDYPAAFALAPHAGTFEGKDGLAVVKRFNSSVMVWDVAWPLEVFTRWTPAVAERLWGDQDWIGELLPDAHAMPAVWFPRLSQCLRVSPMPAGQPLAEPRWAGVPKDARVVLCKKPKNVEAARRWPAVEQLWRAA
jgi:hypothetical protein